MKVVIDTNILIGGSYDQSSYAFKIIKEVIDGGLEAYATHQTMNENRQMLRQLVKDREYRQFLEQYFRKLKIVKAGKELNVVSDSQDNKLFESAAAISADYLISEDQEVLAVEDYHGTRVVTPQQFWTRYQNEKDDDSAWKDWTNLLLGQKQP